MSKLIDFSIFSAFFAFEFKSRMLDVVFFQVVLNFLFHLLYFGHVRFACEYMRVYGIYI